MKLTSMKRNPAEDYAEYNPGQYPCGLSLYLNEEQCEALGIDKALKSGTQISIQAMAIVTSATDSLDRDGDGKGSDISLSIQITDMGVSVEGVLKNAAEVLYGK